ncbi:O-antigen ligase family protein [Bradyrhizobium sp. INPA01-394B]|uniref:O-antigen ligase family protein n=1 Tax=Bradyrhizobium campsiandrae TaxID=1729892 RepID=A0ABR7UA32_9BRAD|nr:O-antigen ligase family protein [Bradyrhizobium campsiandrae]MBC9879337.1 O-antigen ligase family protein [Bradyrhizobium campsiandrae]MBC9980733.1 O-antigen ligase family protein [Bradyrhizobium campsiandrae]
MSSTVELPAQQAVSQRRDDWRDGLLMVALWVWYALLSFPIATVDAFEIVSNQVLIYQGAGLLLFVAAAMILAPMRAAEALGRLTPAQLAIVVIILASLALQFHGPETAVLEGTAYTLALLLVAACLSGLWTMPPDALANCLGGIGIVLVAFGVFSIAVFGWPQGRMVGGIHPNAFGGIMLAAFVTSQFRRGYPMMAVKAVSLVLAAAVSSRFAVIGCILAYLIFELSARPFGSRTALMGVAIVTCLILVATVFKDVLALDDPSRNLDSGFTGRDDQWARALEAISEAPFGLGFKRPPVEDAGHNGYLRWLLEFGVLGGSLAIAATLAITLSAIVEIFRMPDTVPDLRRLGAARAAGLVAVTFASFFQPQLFNLGDVHGVTVILMLFSLRIGSRSSGEGPFVPAARRPSQTIKDTTSPSAQDNIIKLSHVPIRQPC